MESLDCSIPVRYARNDRMGAREDSVPARDDNVPARDDSVAAWEDRWTRSEWFSAE